jgi:hypothetical protein
MACDYAINPPLLDARLTPPKDILIDHRFRGMSAEPIYNLIEEQGTAPSAKSASSNPPRKAIAAINHRSQTKARASPMHLLRRAARVQSPVKLDPEDWGSSEARGALAE